MTLKQLFVNSVKILNSTGIRSSELDVRVLIEHALKINDLALFLRPELPISNADYAKIRRTINRRKKGEPIAYITGHKEFYGYDFLVNKNVLIPRPESEWLVEKTIEFIKLKVSKVHKELKVKSPNHLSLTSKPLTILDMGTGSGCLIISLVKESEKLETYDLGLGTRFYASDISKKALIVAKKNAKHLLCHSEQSEESLDNKTNIIPSLSRNLDIALAPAPIKFLHSDLFSNRLLNRKFDLIIANLPYVPKTRIKNSELRIKQGQVSPFCHSCGSRNLKIPDQARDDIFYEPQSAIFADDNGAKIIKKFLIEAKNYLAENGTILLELDPRNAKEIEEFAKIRFPNNKIELKKDLARKNRYLTISHLQ